MKHFRSNNLALFLICLIMTCFVVVGCGKKGADSEKVMSKTTEKAGQAVAGKAVETERPVPSSAPITEERVFYDFEYDLAGWEIPMWALGKSDYVAKDAKRVEGLASSGNGSLQIITDFSGGLWSAALIEIQQYLDLSKYRVISVDIYLPPEAPVGLKAKLILTVGSNWKFVEMSRSVPLVPGKWTVVTANVEPGSYDWKRVVPNEEFASDVRKVAVRIEANRKPQYSGMINIDNIRVGR